MPQELPGFYFDPEKNRYFPIKGPIPGSRSHTQTLASISKSEQLKGNEGEIRVRKEKTKTSKLLELRELNGNVLNSRISKRNFQHEYEKEHASQPTIWKYKCMQNIANGALEHVHTDMQTLDGQIKSDFLLIGRTDNSLNIYEVAKVGMHFDYGVEYVPDPIWPSVTENQEVRRRAPQHKLLRGGQLYLNSNISSIKAMGKCSPFTDEPVFSVQQALISTMGSGTSVGSVYILKLREPSDFNPRSSLSEVASLNCTIWTSECHPNGSQAVIGTNRGAALLNLETKAVSWLCHAKSDVFSQQFNQAGNVILCGFRNGAIVTVDVRQKQQGCPGGVSKHRIPFSSNKSHGNSSRNTNKRPKGWFELKGCIHPSSTIFMPSSISSLISLQTDDQYFLASSMDGSMKLYDHRLIQRGPVQSYEGHVNSHSRIQLGVDPAERMLMSGGEDGKVRIWSIKTGELLFGEKILNSVPTTLCWPDMKKMCSLANMKEENSYHKNHHSGAWIGSADDLCYIHDS
ncbi:hypothetical protein ACHQM5_004028 [Ranunculus cassubicifolius]